MSPQIRFNNGRAGETTTWVCAAPQCAVPYLGEALSDAMHKGVAIGLNIESRSILVHYPEPQLAQVAQRRLQSMLGKGGSSQKIVEEVEALDLFHVERWGLVPVTAPAVPSPTDEIVEEDDLSSCESEDACQEELSDRISTDTDEADPMEILRFHPDLFSLVAQQEKRTVCVPGIVRALTVETSHEKELRADMLLRGGALSEDLERRLFPRGKSHVQQVQEETRALAGRKLDAESAIFWISAPPNFLTVCIKPNMHQKRRVEWILWKAEKLKLEKTLPVLMALFKQVTCYVDDENRLKQFKQAMKIWKGASLNWKDLAAETRHLVRNINEGNLDCYCKSCSRVLDPKSGLPFCSTACASLYCRCGEKFEIRSSTDWDRLGVLRARLGPYSVLLELTSMLRFKGEVDACRDQGGLGPKFSMLTERRKQDKCCTAIEGLMDSRWCPRCLSDFQQLNTLGRYVELVRSGKVSWGHCEAAAERLKKMKEIPVPKIEEKYCASCEASKKRVQIL